MVLIVCQADGIESTISVGDRFGVHVLPLAYYVHTRVSWWRFVCLECFDAEGAGDAVSILFVSRTTEEKIK